MESERDRAISWARQLYEEKMRRGMDFRNGPCLSEETIPSWCVDIAHIPRRAVDDLPQNQCASFRTRKVSHCVELDLAGNVIRTPSLADDMVI